MAVCTWGPWIQASVTSLDCILPILVELLECPDLQLKDTQHQTQVYFTINVASLTDFLESIHNHRIGDFITETTIKCLLLVIYILL